ncbi:glycoside hydrolase family 130 protein [Acidisphaera sp. L21]|uniref:glycoside hydrolase family 130 protein n=1 Tax=Acidisphaera sp. L21 TaxID=1641851 RepID=UPI00131DCEBD|nr:glycoside hydrolase family 130 protein [Acidisphaera sp. L21]
MSDNGFLMGPDSARVVLLPFTPAAELRSNVQIQDTRVTQILGRILALDDATVERQLADVTANFDDRHRDLTARFEGRAAQLVPPGLTESRRRLAGAYFLMEYAFESAALFNPSVVAHPDQSGAPEGGLRFIISLRAVGEGHVSSLTFRSGTVTANGRVTLDPAARLASLPHQVSRESAEGFDTVTFAFDPTFDLSERVIFPMTPAQSKGIEDARFVVFADGDARHYCATYTAYNGQGIRSELIETTDFTTFRSTTLQGTAARNKGMALFPRKIDGRYAMISREDAENLYLVTSDNLYTWNDGVVLLKPKYAWELIQIGNCGSPIELDEGWLLFIHGVGPVRNYAIGAVLLDKADPSRVLARSREPLLRPMAATRGGYVPNVVYSCGGMRHGDCIILPYGVSDMFSHVTTMRIDTLLRTLDPA